MTHEEQRIAIAEACGWKWSTEGHWMNKNIPGRFHNRPDYLNDLNAMHEAEKRFLALAPKQAKPGLSDAKSDYWKYQFELSKVTHAGADGRGPLFIICATAAQRAEAFLRTIDKWKEDKWKECHEEIPDSDVPAS